MPLATPDPRRRLFVQGAMLGTLRLVAAFNVILLVAICLFLLVQGLPALSWEFLSTPPREMMTAGGILPCIVGTAILALGSLLLAFPLGVATAVYLHEYAGNTPFARMVRLGVNNLAGVPSVVFGLFGLSFFVTFCGMGVSILSGILTLAVLTLPVIISTAEESLRSVPDTYRQASLALGAGKAQTITRVVLPCAMPGMLTGAILGVPAPPVKRPPSCSPPPSSIRPRTRTPSSARSWPCPITCTCWPPPARTSRRPARSSTARAWSSSCWCWA